tara:strand:+ start:2641 stop:3498 length:858 start_codon:yes stop_codon:yes gene_type:complete
MKIRLTEIQYSKLIKEVTLKFNKDITPLVEVFIGDIKDVTPIKAMNLFFNTYKLTLNDIKSNKLLYKTIYNIDWWGVSENIVVDRYKYSEIVEFFLQSEFGRIMNMSTPYQRFNNLFSLRNKFDGWEDMKTMDKINHQMMNESFLVIEDILNTYSGVEAIKRLSIFNERTKYKFHTEISDAVNNITKENGLTLVNKSGGYSLQKKEGSMVRQLIDYMTDDVNTKRKTKRGFLEYIGSEYSRGQFATFWSAVNKQGIIEKVGGGSNVTYKLGPNYDDWEKGKVVAF